MADLGLLFSGGKDSALAALLLERFYDVTLVTGSFGITDEWRHGKAAAEALGFDFERIELERHVADTAVEQLRADGYPREAIQSVHEHALETVAAADFDAIADGTRRDDRTPTVPRSLAQSIEDRHDVAYLAPLRGVGRQSIDRLAAETLVVEVGPSEAIDRADYEGELRTLLREEAGRAAVDACFPAHEQSVVVGRQTNR